MSDLSRVEQLLRNALGEDIYEVTPQSRVETLLAELNELIEGMARDPIMDVTAMADMTDTDKLYRYNGRIYYYNGTEWTEAGSGDDSSIAPQYSEYRTYNVGDLVFYNNTLYQCTTAISTPESFSFLKWTATNIATVIAAFTNADTEEY